MPRARQQRPPDPDRLVRRAAGDLHTEDGRFQVSSTGGAGRWYVTDTERHDQLGLALVLGPFGTLEEVRAAIPEQRSRPAGQDGPLPEPAPSDRPRTPRRDRRASSKPGGPEPKPQPEAEPEPVPEPQPPPPPPVRISRARWRPRHDERDAVVATIRRIDDAWLAGDAEAVRDDLHGSVVFVPTAGSRLEGQDAVIEHLRAIVSGARIRAWTERDLSADVAEATAVVRYRYELERDLGEQAERDPGEHADPDIGLLVWVLTRTHDRWRAAWRMTIHHPTDP